MGNSDERIKLFRSSARFYLSNSILAEEYKPGKSVQQDERFYSFVQEDLQFIETSLEQLKERCGTAARLVIYLLYAENRIQADVAEMMGISRRQLQYSLGRWLETGFSTDNAVIPKKEAFKESCRMYAKEKEILNNLPEGKELLREFLADDISFTESSLSSIRDKCGETASHSIYELYGEEKTQPDVASEMGVSRRKFQILLDQWLNTVFGETS